MKVHHLNCGVMNPPGGRLTDGVGGLLHRARFVCHCLLVETPQSLVLVDTGLGLNAVDRPGQWLGSAFATAMKVRPTVAEAAASQVRELGFQLDDVRHIVSTHLDLDHAGGLADFPQATVHVSTEEHRAATAPRDPAERARYPRAQFAHGPNWQTYGEAGETWYGFDAVRQLSGLPPEILLIPLIGHSKGHSGVAVDTGSGWLLHAGDAYMHHGEVDPVRASCPPAVATFETVMEVRRKQRRDNVRRLRELVRAHPDEVTVFSAHSDVELRRMRRQAG